MIVSNAALRAVASVVTCKLQECATDGDDELTMNVIRNIRGVDEGRDIASNPAERAGVIMAREYAGVLAAMMDRVLNPDEPEYTDENDTDQLFVHEVLMDYGTGFGNADAGEPAEEHNKLEEALRCSIDAKALRLWLDANG